jgi:quercetin dioxygenase-like cupin family protein
MTIINKTNFVPNVDISQPFKSKLLIINDIQGSENGVVWHQAGADGPPIHTHPLQEEWLTVIEGVLEVYLHKQWHILTSGDTIHIPQNAPHSYRSRSKVDCLFAYQITPKGGFSDMMRCFEQLSKSGKIKTLKDFKSLIYLAMAFKKFNKDVRSIEPPDFVMNLMASLGKLMGFKI